MEKSRKSIKVILTTFVMVIRVTDVTAVPTFRANTTELDPDSGQRTVLILFSTGVSSERVNRIHSK